MLGMSQPLFQCPVDPTLVTPVAVRRSAEKLARRSASPPGLLNAGKHLQLQFANGRNADWTRRFRSRRRGVSVRCKPL